MASRRDTTARFMSFVDKDIDGCWLWTGGKTGNGYGQFWMDGKKTLAHRVSYTLMAGPIGDGLTIDHLCRVRECVNPSHLEVVTLRENCGRAINHNTVKTHCRNGHEYTPENTVIRFHPDGHNFRTCRACQRVSRRRGRAKSRNNT